MKLLPLYKKLWMTCHAVIGRDLEQDFRDRLTVVRSQADQESEVLLQQVERERSIMQEELWLLRAREVELQEELRATTQVSSLVGCCDITSC